MTDFPNADEWTEVGYWEWYRAHGDNPENTNKETRYYVRKPQEPTYTPSPAANRLGRALRGRLTTEPEALRIIDQALDAARQQGRSEADAETVALRHIDDSYDDHKDSQGAGSTGKPGLGTNGPDSDGSTVASPLRGRCPNCQQPTEFADYGHFDPKAQRYTCHATDCASQWHQIRKVKRAAECPLCGGED